MPNCRSIDSSIKRETGGREGFVLLALLTEWHLHCLKKIQSKEHSEFPRQQERFLFNKIKDHVKKLKNKLISFDVKDLKDIGVSLLDYETVEDTNFKEFLVESLLSSYRAISDVPFSKSKLRDKSSYRDENFDKDWEEVIEQFKQEKIILGSDTKVKKYLKVRRDANSLYKIYSVISSFKEDFIDKESISVEEKRLALQTVFHITGEYLKDTKETSNLSPDIKQSLKEKKIPVKLLSKFRDMLAHNQILPLIEANDEEITELFKKCFLPIQEIIKNKIIEIESNFVKDIIKRSESQAKDKSVIEKLAESEREQGIQGLIQYVETMKQSGLYNSMDKKSKGLVDEVYQNAKRMRSNDFPEDMGRLPSGTDTYKKEPEDAIKQYIYESKSKVYDKLYDELHLQKLKDICNFKNAHDDAVEVTKMIDYLRYGSPVFQDNVFDNFLNKEVFKEIPLKVNGHDTTLKKELEKYFDVESFKKKLPVEMKREKCIELLERNPSALKEIYDDILEDRATKHFAYQKLVKQYQLTNRKNINVKMIDDLIQNSMDTLYLDRIKKEVGVLKEVIHPYAVEAQIINLYSLLERAEGSREVDFQLRKLRNYLAHGDVLTSNEDDEFLAEQLAQLKKIVMKELGNTEITFKGIKSIINKLQSNLSIDKIRQILCPISRPYYYP